MARVVCVGTVALGVGAMIDRRRPTPDGRRTRVRAMGVLGSATGWLWEIAFWLRSAVGSPRLFVGVMDSTVAR